MISLAILLYTTGHAIIVFQPARLEVYLFIFGAGAGSSSSSSSCSHDGACVVGVFKLWINGSLRFAILYLHDRLLYAIVFQPARLEAHLYLEELHRRRHHPVVVEIIRCRP